MNSIYLKRLPLRMTGFYAGFLSGLSAPAQTTETDDGIWTIFTSTGSTFQVQL